ncbi:MAG: uroporphyrinogen decarboxylase family protein [Actinobacteria bacterium]|nr:uroporphyrinogen decarboxylase family protein [Actinomycetota bacterium]
MANKLSSLSSRERVLKSIKHEEPDRVPIDFGGKDISIHFDSYAKLRRLLCLDNIKPFMLQFAQGIVKPHEDVLTLFNVDVATFRQGKPDSWELKFEDNDNYFYDEWGVKYRKSSDGMFYDYCEHPMKELSKEKIEKIKWPDPEDPGRLRGIRKQIQEEQEKTGRAIALQIASGLNTVHFMLRGLEQSFIDIAEQPFLVDALMEQCLQWQVESWRLALDLVGDLIDVVELNDDLGGQDGPLYPPKFYREVVKPRHAELVREIKRKTKAHFFIHSCGSIYEFIPDLIECGIEIINPVQVNARDMDSVKLKRDFGKYLTFWGGACNTVVLQTGSPEEVISETKKRIEDFKDGGGFVFGPIHNIQPRVPPENIVALFDAVKKYGVY